jgi:hypothetical protein
MTSRKNVQDKLQDSHKDGCIRQKGPLYVLADEKDKRYYDWSLQPGQNRKKLSVQGQHRIVRTGDLGQNNRTAPLGQDVQLKQSGK